MERRQGSEINHHRPTHHPVGLYIASELPSISVHSGARQHIDVGMRELSQYFEMRLTPELSTTAAALQAPAGKSFLRTCLSGAKRRMRRFLPTGLAGTVKDLSQVLTSIGMTRHYLRVIRQHNVSFIYERSAYGQFGGLLAARIAGITHCYEVNGLHAQERTRSAPSWCVAILGWLQNRAFMGSDACFCIGGLHHELGLSGGSVHTAQNGIEKVFAQACTTPSPAPGQFLRILFLGHIMQHHRLDILFDAVQRMGAEARLKITIAGAENPNVQLTLPTNVEVAFTGPVAHDDIPALLAQHDVGVIPYALDFYSNMKTFAYAAGRLALVLPVSRNFRQLFDEDSAFFFDNEDVNDLRRILTELQSTPGSVIRSGTNAYRAVIENFTWDQIFARKYGVIMELLSKSMPGHEKAASETARPAAQNVAA